MAAFRSIGANCLKRGLEVAGKIDQYKVTKMPSFSSQIVHPFCGEPIPLNPSLKQFEPSYREMLGVLLIRVKRFLAYDVVEMYSSQGLPYSLVCGAVDTDEGPAWFTIGCSGITTGFL
ncbi:MAG TPA: hypothetical protein V6D07_18770 [Trichocoleus sp.]